MRQPAGATKAWSTIILEPTDHISRVGQDSEVTKSTRSVVVANPVLNVSGGSIQNSPSLVWAEADSASFTAAASQLSPILASATLLIMSSLTLKQKFSMNDCVQEDFKSNEKVAIRWNAGPR